MGAQFLYPRLPYLLRIAINFSASGDNIVVPADPINRIIVHRMWLVTSVATNITFKDNLPSPAAAFMGNNGALVFDATGEPWFITDPNTSFIINQSGTAQISGVCHYTLAV